MMVFNRNFMGHYTLYEENNFDQIQTCPPRSFLEGL